MTDKKMADPKASRNDSRNSSTDTDYTARFLDAAKNASERLRVDVKTYRGKTYIDIRDWYATEDGEYRPSSKGITVKPTMAPELMRGISLAARSFDPKGVN